MAALFDSTAGITDGVHYILHLLWQGEGMHLHAITDELS